VEERVDYAKNGGAEEGEIGEWKKQENMQGMEELMKGRLGSGRNKRICKEWRSY